MDRLTDHTRLFACGALFLLKNGAYDHVTQALWAGVNYVQLEGMGGNRVLLHTSQIMAVQEWDRASLRSFAAWQASYDDWYAKNCEPSDDDEEWKET